MISGTPVERVSSFKYLGVNISEDLTWTTHIQTQVKKARQRLYHLRQKKSAIKKKFVFKARHGLAPIYISDLLHFYSPERTLRSSSQKLLIVPKSSLKSKGNRALSVLGPTLWNSLSLSIRSSPLLSSYKSSLKTYILFSGF